MVKTTKIIIHFFSFMSSAFLFFIVKSKKNYIFCRLISLPSNSSTTNSPKSLETTGESYVFSSILWSRFVLIIVGLPFTSLVFIRV